MTAAPVTAASRLLDAAIASRRPEMATLTRAVLARMRGLIPGAAELVYDKRNSLVIGFGPDERPSHAISSIAVYTKWIYLYFLLGDELPDPEHLLQGTGSLVRSLRITDAAELDRPAVKALIAAARKLADPPFRKAAKRRVIIRQSL